MTKRKTQVRTKGNRYCRLNVEIRDDSQGPDLSITGESGRVTTPQKAKKMALQYWVSFFEECPEELHDMNRRMGTRFHSSKSAAKFVLDTDGDYHGLDVTEHDKDRVFISESYGQIKEELLEFFPEVEPYLGYHLNGMNAGCVHQKALGWGHGKDIALSKDDLTPAQREALEAKAKKKAEKRKKKEIDKRHHLLQNDPSYRLEVLRSALGKTTITLFEVEAITKPILFGNPDKRSILKRVHKHVEKQVSEAYPPEPIRSKVYENSLCAPCPECGYEYGSAWLYEPLPQKVFDWFESL